MAVGRYLIVSTDRANGAILDGPVLWDPDTDPDYDPGHERVAIPEDVALAHGYTRPGQG